MILTIKKLYGENYLIVSILNPIITVLPGKKEKNGHFPHSAV